MAIAIGYGTTFTWDGDAVGELTRISPVNITISKQDSTNLGATDAFKTILPGLLDPGDVELEGWFAPGDTGQAGMLADMLSRTVKEGIITFPTAISSSTWTFDAYVTAFTAGDATPEGIVLWTATVSITGKPVLGVTATTGPTDILIDGSVSGALTEVPTYAAGTYGYIVDTSSEATVNVTVTAPSATTITMNVDSGADIALATTVASGEQAVAAGTIVTLVITVTETLKSPKTYTFRCMGGL